ncbi:MAG: hypothetical protein FWC87_00135 [Acidimicrobiaceae bacterium]|nr:hypothetical protein [Acidimicrobiaceae bacterium]
MSEAPPFEPVWAVEDGVWYWRFDAYYEWFSWATWHGAYEPGDWKLIGFAIPEGGLYLDRDALICVPVLGGMLKRMDWYYELKAKLQTAMTEAEARIRERG